MGVLSKTWLLILDKFIIPFGGEMARKWVRKRFLTPRALFQLQEGELQEHQRRTLEILNSLGLRPANNRAATQSAISEIGIALSELLGHDAEAENRRFGINFLQRYTGDMTIVELMRYLQKMDLRTLASVVKSVSKELCEDPAVRLISTRDVFSGLVQQAEVACQKLLQDANLIKQYLDHPKDVRVYQEASPLGCKGIDAPTHSVAEQREIREAQMQMKRVGRDTARQRCSRTHIVMSVAIGSGWASGRSPRYMVITAGNTDKSNLLIPSHTPVVVCEDGQWGYYGDPDAGPSSEIRSHWTMHERLAGAGPEWSGCRWIFHAHLVDLIDLSRRHSLLSSVRIGDRDVPNLDWTLHGTPTLGEQIAQAMTQHSSRVVLVKEHGPWFVAPDLGTAFQSAMDAVNTVRQL